MNRSREVGLVRPMNVCFVVGKVQDLADVQYFQVVLHPILQVAYREQCFKNMLETNTMALSRNLSTISKHSIAGHSEIARV